MRYLRAYLERAADGTTPDEDAPLRFVASTEGKKGDFLDLRMAGCQLDRFRSNPVFLWAHNYRQPPIGRVPNVEVDGGRLLCDVEFDRDDPVGMDVERKYRKGFLNAVSIGFDIDEWTRDEKEDCLIVTQWTLTEISSVPVPMDENALVESGRSVARALSAGLISFEEAVASMLGTKSDQPAGEFDELAARLEAAGFVRTDPAADRSAPSVTINPEGAAGLLAAFEPKKENAQ